MRMGVLSLGDTTGAGIFTANPGAPNGIEPGSACYDASHDPGYVHGVSDVEYMLQTPFGYNVTTQLSDAEIACLAQSVAGGNGGAGTVDNGGGNASIPNNCPWYCSLPGVSSILTAGCNPATCNPSSAPSPTTNLFLVGGLALAGILLFAAIKK